MSFIQPPVANLRTPLAIVNRYTLQADYGSNRDKPVRRYGSTDEKYAKIAISCPQPAPMWDLHGKEGERTLWLSSSGGGLFGRPMTRKSYGALLNFWELFSS